MARYDVVVKLELEIEDFELEGEGDVLTPSEAAEVILENEGFDFSIEDWELVSVELK